MASNHQGRTPKVYSIQVSGIKCTNCAGKIKKGLGQGLNDPDAKISVNIIQQKVSLTTFKDTAVQQAVEILINIGFPPVGQPVTISGNNENQRSIAFLVQNTQYSKGIQGTLASTLGIEKCNSTIIDSKRRINVVYNCEIIKGKQLQQIISQNDENYDVINDRINSFSNKTKIVGDNISIPITAVLCIYFFVFDMILPIALSQQGWYDSIITFPSVFGIYTLFVIFNFIITLYVLIKYALGFIKRAAAGYWYFRSMNMETLIALGSVSAFSLFIFFIIKYTVSYAKGDIATEDEYVDAILDINEALTSSAIIVLVVTIGKYFETKVKQRIQKMTQEIFPESTLFANMKVNYVQIKNRLLKIVGQKMIDASLVEKNDVIRIVPGRLLLDVIIIQGSASAMQSARTGCEDIITVSKGQRLESGSQVKQSNDCLAIVENVLEKSLLIQIGTQVKLSQNQQSNEQSGIQAVCKTVSNYFVKGVILLSLLTMVIWALVLFFMTVDVPSCDFCWIFQRGISVLVASCPCAIGLAVPSTIAVILNLATKSGILIKNNSVFQKMKKAKVIAFDKTGTLFTKINKIEEYILFSESIPEAKIWEIVALVEKEIRHPLAEVLYKQAFRRSQVFGTNYGYILLDKPKVEKSGIQVKIMRKDDKKQFLVSIGNKKILQNKGIQVPSYQKRSDAATDIFVAIDGEPLMVVMINTHSNLRPESKEVIQKIKEQNLQVHILSGDSAQSVEKLGEHLDIPLDCQHPEQSTFNKMEWIRQIQKDDQNVAIMIGDGLNDIPCLQEAGIGMSINAKSQLNINAADVVILSQNLHKILAFIRFLKRANTFININIGWAFTYNLCMLPIVTGALFPLNIYISPVESAIAMSIQSLIVACFCNLLTFFTYDQSLSKQQHNQTLSQTNYQQDEKYLQLKDEISIK